MPAGFSRLKVWTDLEILTDEDLNDEFDNILENLDAINVGGYGNDVPEMQTQQDPGDLGTEVTTDNLAEDIAELRFVIARIIGKDYWYQTPDRTLGTETDTSSLVSYFPMNCPEATTESGFGDIINRGGIINAISQSGENISESSIDTTNKKFGNASFFNNGPTACLGFSERYGVPLQGSFGLHFRNLGASASILCNPTTQMEAKLDASGFAVFTTKLATAASNTAKNSKTVTGSTNRALNAAWQHLAIRYALNGINGSGTDLLQMQIDGEDEGTQLDTQNMPVNASKVGTWFLNGKLNNPSFQKFSAMNVLPTAETPAWTATGTAGHGTVSGGILTINSPAIESAKLDYSVTTLDGSTAIDLSQFHVDFKIKVNPSNPAPNSSNDPYKSTVYMVARDDSMDRGFVAHFHRNGIAIENTSGTGTSAIGFVACDLTNWTHVRLCSHGATDPTLDVYVGGILMGKFTIDETDSTVADTFKFGHNQVSSGTVISYWEWMALYSGSSSTIPPVVGGAQGNFDDLVYLKSVITDTTIDLLSEKSGQSVFGVDKIDRVELPYDFIIPQSGGSQVSDTSFARQAMSILTPNYPILYVASDGRTPISMSAMGELIFTTDGPSHTGCIALSQDEDALGAMRDVGAMFPTETISNETAIGKEVSFGLERKEVMPVGLHKIEMLAAVDTAACSVLLYKMRISAKRA